MGTVIIEIFVRRQYRNHEELDMVSMKSAFLSNLTDVERSDLIKKLWSTQNGKCFICEEEIDLKIQDDNIDIDHVKPLKNGGKDDVINFALTHSSCNRSKQAEHLEVARILAGFNKLRDKCRKKKGIPDLNDILETKVEKRHGIKLDVDNGVVKYSFSELGDNKILQSNLFKDELSGDKYFFAKIPIEYLHHDDRINPRPIGGSLSGLVKEFYGGNPQLHVQLGHIELDENKLGKIQVFDGQHKAAAQILLGVKELPIRIFIDSNLEKLLETNTRAGTTLKQIAFDKSIERHLGSAQYMDNVKLYQKEHGLDSGNYSFSEKDLVNHFTGTAREMKKFILDLQRDRIAHHVDNKLDLYVEQAGRAKQKPLSYSTIDKTFFSFFISKDLLQTNIDYQLGVGENPRELEVQQIIELMNIIAKELFINKFDFDIGTYRIENRIGKKEQLPEEHVIAYRLAKEEILYVWLGYVKRIIQHHFILMGLPYDENKLFQYKFPPQVWNNVTTFIQNLKNLPTWSTREPASHFSGKQNIDYWKSIFATAKSPTGEQVLAAAINYIDMIKE